MNQPPRLTPLPEAPVARLVGPVARFLHVEAASGGVLLFFTAAALILANSAFSDAFLAFWKTPVGFSAGGFEMVHSLQHWINDGLMAVFFFVIGLEVKREIVLGELRDLRRAALPIAAALGGMIVPAAVYLLFLGDSPAQRGWGIPMATDIAFVVGCLALLGSRIAPSLRVMLLSLAIADDIGAILVIAVGYTEDLNWLALGIGVFGILLVSLIARLGVRSVGVYALVGVAIWFAFHESGVHATIAGVVLGMQTPARPWLSRSLLGEIVDRAGDFLHGGEESGDGEVSAETPSALLRHVQSAARESVSPLERLETQLHPWVSFGVMPLFAFANAGVPFALSDVADPVAVAVMAGLLIGKPVGIVAFSFAAVRSGLARLPEGVGWRAILGAGLLAGIGFTMALFIAGLALEGDALSEAKVGILAGSAVAGLLGLTLLALSPPPRDQS